MDVAAMISYTLSEVDDLQGAYFTQPQLIRYINQAAQECQKKLIAAGNNWYVKVTPDSGVGSFTTTANQATYTPPADLLDLNRLEVVTNPGINETRVALTSITLNQKDFFYGFSQFPAAFYFQKSDIVMCPAPQQTGMLIRYYYTYRIPEVTLTSETVDVPPEFHEYVVAQVIIKCLAKDGRDASLFAKIVDETEKRLEKQAIQRAQDHAPQVTLVSEGAGFGGFY